MEQIINDLVSEIESSNKILDLTYENSMSLDDANQLFQLFKEVLFPTIFIQSGQYSLDELIKIKITNLSQLLVEVFKKIKKDDPQDLANQVLLQLPELRRVLVKDVQAVFDGDPAAKTYQEVLLAYPSFEAILGYRIAHYFSSIGLLLLARVFPVLFIVLRRLIFILRRRLGIHFVLIMGSGWSLVKRLLLEIMSKFIKVLLLVL